ncbi:hypothetical protein BH11BAC3_BH11BAC3_26640 [soil metagenome]
MKILIVDSSALIIERLQDILTESDKITAVYGTVSYNDCMNFFRKISPGVVLIDSSLPGNTCIDLVKVIKTENDQISVIVMLNGEEEAIQEKCKSSGADLFFDKYHEFEKIPTAINRIIAEKTEEQIYEK